MKSLIVYYGGETVLKEFKKENKDSLNEYNLIFAQNRDVDGIRLEVVPN